MEYKFCNPKILGLNVRIGVDVRPPIEVRLEQERFLQFSKQTRQKYPQIFDTMVLGDQQFEMKKTWVVPGKGEVEAQTFVMTQRGPLFRFPVLIGEIELEPDLPDVNETFVNCMKTFLTCFPTQKVVRVGKVHEHVFDCGDINSLQLVNDRFVNIAVPEGGEIRIRVNLCTPEFNRIFTIDPVTRLHQASPDAKPQAVCYGVKVDVDVNNRILKDNLSDAELLTVLTTADMYVADEMYDVLNGKDQS